MPTEMTAAQLDAQADEALEHMEATGWQAPNANETGTDGGQAAAPADAEATGTGEQQATDDNTGGKPAEAVDLAALEEIANPRPAAEIADPLQFNVQAPSDYETAKAALLAEKAEAMRKLMDAEINAEEFSLIEASVMDRWSDLNSQKTRAETLLEVNAQTAAQAQGAVIQALIVRAKDEVPYETDAKAQKQFDMALKIQLEDPENSGKPFAHTVNQAHKVVLALRGVQEKPATQNKGRERNTPEVPVTLSGLPNAGGSGEKSVTQVLSGLSGPDFDRAFDALPKDQQQKYLKQA